MHHPLELPGNLFHRKLEFFRNVIGGRGMKKNRSSREQIIGILKQHEAGVKMAEVWDLAARSMAVSRSSQDGSGRSAAAEVAG
jgi:hypothetical protein